MTPPSRLPAHLRETLSALLAGTHSRRQLNDLVALCHALAAAFLESKRAGWALVQNHGYTFSDLSFDCIGDLFQQESEGEFVQLRAYFGGLSLDSASEQEVLVHLRRLVFSKVNHRVFRIYHELDPSLARVLRNVKLAVQTIQGFTEVERYGEIYLRPACTDALEHLPAFPPERLLDELSRDGGASKRIPDLLARVAFCLRSQDQCSRLITLIDLATIIRKVYAVEFPGGCEGQGVDDRMVRDDMQRIVRRSCASVCASMESRYVGRKGVPAEVFRRYRDVVEQSVLERLLGDGGDTISLFDRLRLLMPDLHESEYRKVHRSRVEYLGRLAYKRAVRELRREH